MPSAEHRGDRRLVRKPRLVIFDQPTHGVDAAAISSYLPGILKLSDRILVCRQGRVVEEFSPLEASEERIMYAAVH